MRTRLLTAALFLAGISLSAQGAPAPGSQSPNVGRRATGLHAQRRDPVRRAEPRGPPLRSQRPDRGAGVLSPGPLEWLHHPDEILPREVRPALSRRTPRHADRHQQRPGRQRWPPGHATRTSTGVLERWPGSAVGKKYGAYLAKYNVAKTATCSSWGPTGKSPSGRRPFSRPTRRAIRN